MQRVHLRNEERERLEVRPFGDEELARTRVEMIFIRRVHFVAPGAGLRIEIREVGKGPPREKIGLHVPKRPLDAGGSIGVAFLVGAEGEVEALSKGSHFGGRHHLRARARGDDDMGVINHARRASTGHELKGVGEKDLAGEPGEDRIHLHEKHPRTAQDERRGVERVLDPADAGAMRRRVMLHLRPHRKLVVADRRWGRMADPMPPAKRGKGRIRDLDALGGQLFVHPNQIALALGEELEDLLAVGPRFLRPIKARDRRRAGGQHRPHRSPGDRQRAGNLPDPMAFRA